MQKLPANQGTNIRKANAAIAATQNRIERAQTQANGINVSSTSAVYSSLESATGLSSGGVSRIAAIMLSVTPLTLGIAIAGLSSSVRRKPVKATKPKGESVKKHKRHLQAG